MKEFDKNKIFSIDGIHKNENFRRDMDLIIREMKGRIFNDDFPAFFGRFDEEMTKYSKYFYDKLIGELLSVNTTRPIYQSGLLEKQYYKNIRHIMKAYQSHLKKIFSDSFILQLKDNKVLKLDFNVIANLYKYYSENLQETVTREREKKNSNINEINNKYFFRNLYIRYSYKAFETEGFKGINDLMRNLEPHEYIELFLGSEEALTFIGKQPKMIDGVELTNFINRFWALCLRLDNVFFDNENSLDKLHELFTDIDSFKAGCKKYSISHSYQDSLEETFCDEIKACLLTKYADFEKSPNHILKMIENDYDIAFEEVNGISFQDYLMNDNFAELNDKLKRNQQIIDVLEVKSCQRMRM